MNNFCLKIIVIIGLMFFQPTFSSQVITKKINTAEKFGQKSSEEIPLNIFSTFKKDDSEFNFVNGNTQLLYKNDNTFTLKKKGLADQKIDVSESNYEGPGFSAYSFSSKNKNVEVILIEATADVGTDWYYAVILKAGKIIDKFFIKEPRSNSDIIKIQDYLNVSVKNHIMRFKFNKQKVAKYSKVPDNLKSDKNYLYLEKKISE